MCIRDSTYTVVEDTVENYVTSKGEGAYDIKNTYNPGKTSITVNKVWDDSENQDGKRPERVCLLYTSQWKNNQACFFTEGRALER